MSLPSGVREQKEGEALGECRGRRGRTTPQSQWPAVAAGTHPIHRPLSREERKPGGLLVTVSGSGKKSVLHPQTDLGIKQSWHRALQTEVRASGLINSL